MLVRFVTKRWPRWMWYTLLIVLWLALLIVQIVRSPFLTCMLGFTAIIGSCIALTFLFMPPMQKKVTLQQPLPSQGHGTTSLPSGTEKAVEANPPRNLSLLPQTRAELCTMNPKRFELLSAAVLVACEGHQFHSHSGRRGDRGVDVRLLNSLGLLVIVQCKRNALSNPVGPAIIRELGGTLRTQDAVYGYCVTSSTFTSAAYQEKAAHGRIHTLDGTRLMLLLQHYPYQIAQALDDIDEKINTRT